MLNLLFGDVLVAVVVVVYSQTPAKRQLQIKPTKDKCHVPFNQYNNWRELHPQS